MRRRDASRWVEAAQRGSPVRADQHVRAVDGAVHHARRVQVGQGRRHSGSHARHLLDRQPAKQADRSAGMDQLELPQLIGSPGADDFHHAGVGGGGEALAGGSHVPSVGGTGPPPHHDGSGPDGLDLAAHADTI